jgi:hydrogenase maturation factor HypF (carbamoyltransferase family)
MGIIKASIPKFCESCEKIFNYATEGFFVEGQYQCQACANEAFITQNEIVNAKLARKIFEVAKQLQETK